MYQKGIGKGLNDSYPILCWNRQLLCLLTWLIKMMHFCSCSFPLSHPDMFATLKILLEKHLSLFFQTLMQGQTSKPEGSSGQSHEFPGCFCFGVLILVQCAIIFPKEVHLDSSFCFEITVRSYELKNQTSPCRLKSCRLQIRTKCFLQRCFV